MHVGDPEPIGLPDKALAVEGPIRKPGSRRGKNGFGLNQSSLFIDAVHIFYRTPFHGMYKPGEKGRPLRCMKDEKGSILLDGSNFKHLHVNRNNRQAH